MWSAMSKVGASVHSGQPSPSRGRYSSCRNRGTRCSLGSSCSRTASLRTRPPGSSRLAPSRTASPPMSLDQRRCPGHHVTLLLFVVRGPRALHLLGHLAGVDQAHDLVPGIGGGPEHQGAAAVDDGDAVSPTVG